MSIDTSVAEWARQMNVSRSIATEVCRLAEASKVSDLAGVMALGRLVLQEQSREKQEANSQRNQEARAAAPEPSAMERLRLANRQNAHRNMRAERKQRNGK